MRGGERAGERIPALEGMRGLLALYVVLGHAATLADPSALAGRRSTAPDALRAVLAPLQYGHLAVAAFIVLSGYCLALARYQRGFDRVHDVDKFFRNRARRILPAYYAALGLSVLAAWYVQPWLPGMPFDLYRPMTAENLFAHLFLVHNLRPEWMYKINGVLWSIALEAQLYVLFPLLLAWLGRWGRGAFLAALGAASAALYLLLPGAPKLYPWYLGLFGLGMATASLAYRAPRRTSPSALAGLLLAAVFAAGLVGAILGDATLPGRDVWGGLLCAALAYVVTVGPRTGAARFLGSRALAGLGAFSYSLYLVHHPALQTAFLFRPEGARDATGTFLWLLGATPVVLLLSWVFGRVFEGRATLPPRPPRTLVALPVAPAGQPLPGRS